MKNKLLAIKLALIFVIAGLFMSCKDDYVYEEKLPPSLNGSIYDYLKDAGNYTYYVRLIDDLSYTDVLSKTGSKTLFVADDATFERFFSRANSFNVTRYEELTQAQKRMILNSSMLNNAILIEKMATVEGPVSGQAIRRATQLSVTDTIGVEPQHKIPANSYWDRFRAGGMRLLKDNTPSPMVFFLDEQMSSKNITKEDFSLILGKEWDGGAYVYGIKVKEKNLICMNGYIHVLEDVLEPPSNMAEVMLTSPETQKFSSYMERFAAPYFSGITLNNDSVFMKGYFSERSNVVEYNRDNKSCIAPNGSPVSDMLLYDPGWNRYYSSEITGSFQTDMGVIFAPTNEALTEFFTNGIGQTLINEYGSEENIPNEVLVKLLRNHMKPSFLASVPSQFDNIMNDAQEPMGIDKGDIVKTYLASNGAVYVTNKVYAPAIYSSVMLPAVINENMKVFYWAINNLDFSPYLLSMVNEYAFFLPRDNFTYIVPTSLKKVPVAWKFHFDDARQTIYASVHNYDVNTHVIGDSTNVVRTVDFLKNHLEDMLDYHIVVVNTNEFTSLESDTREFYRTKGGGTLRIKRSGSDVTEVSGGGDIERGQPVAIQDIRDLSKSKGGNGKTYIIDDPVQSPLRSVYGVMEETPEFSDFFELLKGNDALWTDDDRRRKYTVFYVDQKNAGLDYNVRFLNTFHYTLYVPTNAAVQDAYAAGLPTWADVAAEMNEVKRDSLAEKIIRFVRYHFQDNSVFVEKNISSKTASYETATLNNETSTFYQLTLSLGSNSLGINTASGGMAQVVTTNPGLYNIMARDFKFNSPTPQSANTIETSSYIVIHQIDECLYFE